MDNGAMSRVAIITGAGSGIGRAVALGMADAGFKIALFGRRSEPLEKVAAQCSAAKAFPVDITSERAVEDMFDQVVETFGRIDLLFNNAGAFPARASLDEVGFEQWRAILDVNLDGAFLCARAAFKRMRHQTPRGGRIINNGSLSAQVPRPQAAAYTVSKHAITGLTKAILLDGRPFDIVAGQIDIGNAGTDLTTGLEAGALQPDGQIRPEPMMDVKEAADAVLLMASQPLTANIPFLTVMASGMPFVGRG